MKMKKKTVKALWALLLAFAMILPMMVGCTAEEASTTTQGAFQPETEDKFVPQGPTDVLPENRLDYENSESLAATPNAGKGNRVESSTEMGKSEYSVKLEKEAMGGEGRRDTALQAMRDSLSVKWTPEADVTYSYHPNAYAKSGTKIQQTADFNKNQITLKAGQMYQGIPYTHGSAGLAAFTAATEVKISAVTYPIVKTNNKVYSFDTSYYTPCGITKNADGSYVVPLNSQILSGSNAVSARLGADGIDALYWAWATIGSELFFVDLATFLKDEKVQLLGGYTANSNDTASILGSDLAKAKAAYATLGVADALVSGVGGEERALMVVSVNAAAGTVTVMEQTPANLVAAQGKTMDVVAIGALNEIYTFDELFAAGFVPATNLDFHHNEELGSTWMYAGYRDKTVWNKINGAFSDDVTAGRRIAYVKVGVSITKKVNGVSQTSYCSCVAFPTESEIMSGQYFSADLDRLPEASNNGLVYGFALNEAGMKTYRNNEWYRVRLSIGFSDGTEAMLRDFYGASSVDKD